ncbi:TetR/AcrR family transcriptional regulator [Frankia sp. AgPm24]|nr:TetR/AcrR family transcriptional regulator [Frankia sp. AgPm24]MCK9921199.1 TetR/AcrR family transcriptional regulator [Frankia sp. AgPm24]
MTPRRSADPGQLTFTEQARRRQLIECTIDLVSTRDYAATSLSAIAEAVGISKAAVLYHFASKDRSSSPASSSRRSARPSTYAVALTGNPKVMWAGSRAPGHLAADAREDGSSGWRSVCPSD